jgi:hypothetical protein
MRETRAKKREISERPFYSFAPTSAGRSLRLCEKKKNKARKDAKPQRPPASKNFSS